jgi:multiple sugar transport system ATP-binding protein
MIAGLETISEGSLYIGERRVNDVPPRERDTAMVFQNYALYPHMTVYDNLSFGLRLQRVPREEIEGRVRETARILGMADVLERKPRQLSGGQRQRVALGRAIVRKPQVFLFDEPLSNLDAELQVQMRGEITRLHRRLAATMIYVTHDQVEAMTLGERIAVLGEGRIHQVGPPLVLYEQPANRFVAGFLGSPTMNFVDGEVMDGGGLSFRARDDALTLDLHDAKISEAWKGRWVTLGIRPEDIHMEGAGVEGRPSAAATLQLEFVEALGNEIFVHARAREQPIVARVAPRPLPEPGGAIRVFFDVGKLHFFDSETGDRIVSASTR